MSAPAMSSSDQLRRAAAKLRETAAKATPGPWHTVGLPWNHGIPYVIAGHSDPHAGKFVADVEQIFGEDEDERDHAADAAWIALASPALAEPLALWLESDAGLIDDMAAAGFGDDIIAARFTPALTVARVILGEVTA